MHWRTMALTATAFAVGLVYATACNPVRTADAASASGAGRAVVYLDASGDYVWSGGVVDLTARCVVSDGSTADYTACCPSGFLPVGFNGSGEIACLEQ